MFVRIKSTPNSPRKSVQIVQSVRKAGSVSQKIVRHVGVAEDEKELEQLKLLAETIKIKLEADTQHLLFTPEDLAKLKLSKENKKEDEEDYKVNLKDLVEEERIIKGIHDIYGELFNQLNYKNIFDTPSNQKTMVETFKNIVLARIANPSSKRATVDMLEENFGIEINLQKVYRMMDLINDAAVEKLNEITYQNTAGLFGGKIDIIFFDATTIYFESIIRDELRENGYSKDLKFSQTQVLLALMVNKEGLPIGYKIFPGNMYEGHTIIPILKDIREKYRIDKVIIVADSGMMNGKNLEMLEEEGFEYIMGARLRNMKKEMKEKILDKKNYRGDEKYRVAKLEYEDGKKIIVSYKETRARKDEEDRLREIERIKKSLSKEKNIKKYLSNYGNKKYLKIKGESKIELDEEKIAEDKEWDGLHGVITNAKEMPEEEVLKQYVNLWHVEEAFRITKHDLKVRPVYHWTSRRIKAHMAICFTAYALVRHLEYIVKLQYKKMSVEEIRQNLIKVQMSILYDKKQKLRFGFPSSMRQDAKKIYQLMKVPSNLTPWLISKD